MRNILVALFCLAFAGVMTGCAAGVAPVTGVLFTEVSGPIAATTAGGSKTGTAMCTSILGAVAQGDCSIAAAKKAGGISTVSSVDYKTRSFLGLYAEVTTTVRGN